MLHTDSFVNKKQALQKQRNSARNMATILMVLLVVLLTMFGPCTASHGTMSGSQPSRRFTLLQTLGHGGNSPPGNGCNEGGSGGNNCKVPPINGKAFASHHVAASTTASPSPSSFPVPGRTTTNRKLMMRSYAV